MEVMQRLVLALCVLTQVSSGARILGVFGHFGKSHFDAFQPLLEELASRGHDVVVLSHFPRKSPLANYTDVSLVGTIEGVNSTAAVSVTRVHWLPEWAFSPMLSYFGARTCDSVLGHRSVADFLRVDQGFDLVLTEVFNTDCFLGFARRYDAPHIALSSHVLMPWAGRRVGNPDQPAYVRNLFSLAGADMGAWERLHNAAMLVYHGAVYRLVEWWKVQPLVERHFGAGTSLDQLRRNTSLVLVNTHHSVSGARPLVPAVVQVGGMHIQRRPPPLPQDLEEFVSGAEHGLVYFSMGSMIKPETFPADKLRAFVEAFAELPQRVLWKWDAGDLPSRPHNVRTVRWLPQLAVLLHAKTRVYVSHCGNLGTLEAMHAGVPMVGIPLYGDQPNNAHSLEARGVAVLLSYQDISKDNVLRALRTVLEDPRYGERARQVSRAFHDRPMAPLEEAVYWTEYVLRHRGAPLLRSQAVDMPCYSVLLLDAIVYLLLVVVAVLCLLRWAAVAVRARKSKVD